MYLEEFAKTNHIFLFAYTKELYLSLVWRKGQADLRPTYSLLIYFGAVGLSNLGCFEILDAVSDSSQG